MSVEAPARTDSLIITVRPDSLGEAEAKEAVFQIQQVLQRYVFL
jgi:hypothetical protein